MSNYPDGNMNPSDPRCPLHAELNHPTCDCCGDDLSIDVDCDVDGPFTIAYCDNHECPEKGEIV